MSILITNARVVVGDGTVLQRADVLVEDDRISAVRGDGAAGDPGGALQAHELIEADGRVLMPGFVDAHTHALWAGDRLDEWEMKQRGATYLQILEAGGGILSTVRAVRAASEESLAAGLRQRLWTMLHEGTTTVEVKSGYGLTTADELKMLRAIRRACEASTHGAAGVAPDRPFPGTVIPTALLGHAIDPEQPDFVRRTIGETLPAVHEAFPGVAIDAYCEQGAWSVADCRRLFERALELGHPVRLHADQFNALGGLELAVELGAHSVDHLEATAPDALGQLARSDTFGVMLPACGFHVDGRYADGRAFLDAGGKLVLASNCNPGSAPTSSMPMVIALAVRHLGITAAEAIVATTATSARLLGLADRGRVVPGLRADLVLLRHRDERHLGFEFGGNPVDLVICGGHVVASR